MENPKKPFLENIQLNEQTIHFVNSAGVAIVFVVPNEQILYHLYFYLCCNQQLRIKKNIMGPSNEQRNPLEDVSDYFLQSPMEKDFYDYFKQEYFNYWAKIPKELNKLTERKQGFASNCSPLIGKNKCNDTLAAWENESRSISYIALSMAQSFISRQSKDPIIITVKLDGSLSTNVKDENYRTIWGVGPSGCGKSFMTNQITPFIEVETVLAIDGGIFRECSNVWMVATTDHDFGENIEDLYDEFKRVANVKRKYDLLFKQVQCSLYIPDTLASAYYNVSFGAFDAYMRSFNERKMLNRFAGKELPFVGICIMQHCMRCKGSKGCTFPSAFQCKGCDQSGEERAAFEGKSYSNKTYYDALNIGYETMLSNAKRKSSFPIFIHNSGKKGTPSVLALLKDTKYDTMATSLSGGMFKVIRIDGFPTTYNTFEKLLLKQLNQSLEPAQQAAQATDDATAYAEAAHQAAVKIQSRARTNSKIKSYSTLKRSVQSSVREQSQRPQFLKASEQQVALQSEQQAAPQIDANKQFGDILSDTNQLLNYLAARLNRLRPERKKTRGYFWGGRRGTRKRIRGGISTDGIDKYKQLIQVERNQLKLLISMFQKYPNLETETEREIPIEMLTKFLKGFKEVSIFLELQIRMLEEKQAKEEATPRPRSRRWFFQRE
jgi:hypothetical protein